MKTKLTILLIAVLPLFFIGCEKSEAPENIQDKQTPNAELKIQADLCGETTSFVFNTEAGGEGIIGNDENNLYVNFMAPTGWKIQAATIYVGSVEDLVSHPSGENYITGPGTVHVDQATFTIPPYDLDPLQTTEDYIFPLNTLPEGCFIIVIAANFQNDLTGATQGGYGIASNLKSDGYYIDYCVQECESEPECNTAYAYGDDLATCFLDIPEVNSNNWGWSNGPISDPSSYTWNIYAGAGQCDISKGTLVGTLDVNYTGGTATVTYNINPEFTLDETHLYVGNDVLAKDNKGNFTTAPGKFPYSGQSSYTISGLSGDIYVVAHSVVCGDYDD